MANKVRIGVLGAGRIGQLHITNLVQAVPGAEVVAQDRDFLLIGRKTFMANKVRIGVLGAGRIGQLHITNLVQAVPGAEVVAVADPYLSDAAVELCKGLGIENVSKDPEIVFGNKDIDAVFICSSTNTHADFIIEAAKAGKHIFCEKPIHTDLAKIHEALDAVEKAGVKLQVGFVRRFDHNHKKVRDVHIFCEKPIHTDLAKIHEALDAVEKAGVKLQVGFVRRFDHNHKKVRDVVASGRLGAPHIVKVCSRDPEGPPMSYVEVSGGIFLDMMIHDFDMVRYLSGSEVTEVTAYGTVKTDPDYAKYGDVDTAIVMLKFANGAIGVIDNSRVANYGYDQRTEVHCDKGCVQVSNDLDNQAMISTREGVEIAKPTWFFLERYNDAFITEEKDFVDAILNDTEVPVTGHDGLMPVIIAMAAGKSLKEGRPVKLSEIEG